MKTLDDWLASSSSSSSSSSDKEEGNDSVSNAQNTRSSYQKGPEPQAARSNPSQTPTSVSMGAFPGSVSAAGSVASSIAPTSGRTPTTVFSPTSRSSRLDETRAKMEKLLGQETMQRAMSPTSGSSFSGSIASQTAANAPFGMTPVSRNDATSPVAATASGGAGTAEGGVQTPNYPTGLLPSPGSQALVQQAKPDSPQQPYEPVEVMVVDRGTQTVSTVGVQTDPEPPFPPTLPGVSFPPGYTSPSYHLNVQQPGVDYTSRGAGGRFGIDGRPYRQLFHELEQRQSRGAGELREQLEMIQNSIDMLISRYNLPPPPST